MGIPVCSSVPICIDLSKRLRMGKSRILVVGGTGGLGKHLVKGSVKEGHPTFVLVRQSSDPAKKAIVAEFESLGAIALYVCRYTNLLLFSHVMTLCFRCFIK